MLKLHLTWLLICQRFIIFTSSSVHVYIKYEYNITLNYRLTLYLKLVKLYNVKAALNMATNLSTIYYIYIFICTCLSLYDCHVLDCFT